MPILPNVEALSKRTGLPRDLLHEAVRVRVLLERWRKESQKGHLYPRLSGLCGVASSFLARQTGIPMAYGLYKGCEPHYWCISGEYLIDLTATQFGREEKVFVRRQGRPYKKLSEARAPGFEFSDNLDHPMIPWWLRVHGEMNR